ncbi:MULTISPECIES: MgtC/SapB family protein [Eubacteriales]|jgi:putative Mg2+ transporter-C (MgtC) family protein|uniref:MgtC/SapB family protein n=1 Tax=Clostridia TaxID=186801 RepID=UPI000E48468B|nr:MgtC/SapB family protein [Clostridium sp. AM33-3]RHT19388.1 MgtC/SapB family protein [Clostridium sp. AM33-3]
MLKLWPVLAQFTAPELWVQVEYLVRIFVAACLGLLIGSERKNRNKSAGIRTHVIVALGAALIMVVSKYGFMDVEKADAARVAAQVVSGIGFLGAGVIFVRNNLVNGLTTAAGIWATAGVGLALGAGMYVVGISSALLVLLIQFVMHRVAYFADVASGGLIRMTLVKREGIVQSMEDYLQREKLSVISVKINKTKKDEVKLEFDVVFPPGYKKTKLLARLVEMDDVLAVSE